MRATIALIICGAMLCYAGCSKENTQTPTGTTGEDICSACLEESTSQDLVPLAVGNWWQYKYTRYDTLGNVQVADSVVRIWVTDSFTEDSVEYFTIAYRTNYVDEDTRTISYVDARNSAEGFCVGDVRFASERYFYRLYKYPAEFGERYYNSDSNQPLHGSQVLWLVTDTIKVLIHWGFFPCLYYTGYVDRCDLGGISMRYAAPLIPVWGCNTDIGLSGGEDVWFKHYVDPGIGVLKQVSYIVRDGVRTIEEWKLGGYHLE